MVTPHIEARPGDFPELVLLPGDPLRAKHIASTFLGTDQPVTAVRNMLGYTGHWRGMPVSVMGTGMGIPSLSIYATELIRHYGVRRLVRVGTCGAVREDIALDDLILAMGACTDSGVNRQRFGGMDFAATASYDLLQAVARQAQGENTPLRIGNVFSTDLFYGPDPLLAQRLAAMSVLGVEMEAAGLYGVAAEHGVQALTVLTVTDHLLRDEHASASARSTGVDAMTRLVLDALVAAA